MSSACVVRSYLAAVPVDSDPGFVVGAIPDPEGYGVDTWMFDDSASDQRVAVGVEGVVYDVARRYITARGTVGTDLDYGLLLSDFLHGAFGGDARVWELQVEHEAKKDPRVTSAVCRWVATSSTTYNVEINLKIPTVAGSEVRALVFAVSSARVEVLSQ